MTTPYDADHTVVGFKAAKELITSLNKPVAFKPEGNVRDAEELRRLLTGEDTVFSVWVLEHSDDNEELINNFHNKTIKPLRSIKLQSVERETEEYRKLALEDGEIYCIYSPGESLLTLHYTQLEFEVNPKSLTTMYIGLRSGWPIVKDNGLKLSDVHKENLKTSNAANEHVLGLLDTLQTHYRMVPTDQETGVVIMEIDSILNFPISESVLVRELTTGHQYMMDPTATVSLARGLGEFKVGSGILLPVIETADENARLTFYPVSRGEDGSVEALSSAGRLHHISEEDITDYYWVDFKPVVNYDSE